VAGLQVGRWSIVAALADLRQGKACP